MLSNSNINALEVLEFIINEIAEELNLRIDLFIKDAMSVAL